MNSLREEAAFFPGLCGWREMHRQIVTRHLLFLEGTEAATSASARRLVSAHAFRWIVP